MLVMPNLSSMKVHSQNISEVDYDPQSSTMVITFKDDSKYAYLDVPNATYQRLVGAGSVGSYFASHIKGNFITRKLV